MARKKQRIRRNNTPPPKVFIGEEYDTTRFVSEAASIYYYLLLANMEVILERGLIPNETEDNGVFEMIQDSGWKNFTQQPDDVVVVVVREFYAHAVDIDGDVVQVRGKPVSFDSSIINAYFHIRELKDSEGSSKYRNGEFQ